MNQNFEILTPGTTRWRLSLKFSQYADFGNDQNNILILRFSSELSRIRSLTFTLTNLDTFLRFFQDF
jgi:hypothetical protein